MQEASYSSHETGFAPMTKANMASGIIRKYSTLSLATGLIPIPLLDSIALAGIQLQMLKELSETYGIDFKPEMGRAAVVILLGTIGPSAIIGEALGSFAVQAVFRSVPVIGPLAQIATQPAFNGASTYALGKVFQQHFAEGGNFHSFNAEKFKNYFRTVFDDARHGNLVSSGA